RRATRRDGRQRPRAVVVRPRARLLARLRRPRAGRHVRLGCERRGGAAPAGAAPARRRLLRARQRHLRAGDGRGRARVPTVAAPGSRRRGGTAHAHRALRRGGRLSAAGARGHERGDVVSSILDALEKLEAAAPRRPLALGAPVPPVRERRPRLTVAAAFATGALAAAVAAAVLVSRRASLPPPPAARPARAAPAPSPQVGPPVPPPAAATAAPAQCGAPPEPAGRAAGSPARRDDPRAPVGTGICAAGRARPCGRHRPAGARRRGPRAPRARELPPLLEGARAPQR